MIKVILSFLIYIAMISNVYANVGILGEEEEQSIAAGTAGAYTNMGLVSEIMKNGGRVRVDKVWIEEESGVLYARISTKKINSLFGSYSYTNVDLGDYIKQRHGQHKVLQMLFRLTGGADKVYIIYIE